MFGFFFGIVCLVLLIASKRRHRYAFGGFGPWSDFGGGRRDYHRGPWHGPPWRAGYRHPIARNVLARLDTTPGQEKAIRAVLEDLQHNLKDARGDLQGMRTDLAQVVGGDVFDEQALAVAMEKQEAFVNRARNEVVGALKTVHSTLDGPQRRLLAEWIADGMSWRDLRHYERRDWL
jgi:uncharacterized membrane protein